MKQPGLAGSSSTGFPDDEIDDTFCHHGMIITVAACGIISFGAQTVAWEVYRTGPIQLPDSFDYVRAMFRLESGVTMRAVTWY